MTLDEKIAKMHQKNLKDWDEKKPWVEPEEYKKTVFMWRRCVRCQMPIQIGRICPDCQKKHQKEYQNERYAKGKESKALTLVNNGSILPT